MRFFVFFVLLLLPIIAYAQDVQDKCLVLGADDSRVSGTVEYVSYKHPNGEATISGYKLILLKPRCHESTDRETGKLVRSEINEMAITNYGQIQYLQTLIGKTVVITGVLEDSNSPYYVAAPQITPTSLAACEVSTTAKGIEKC